MSTSRCCTCGSREIVAIAPGSEPVVAPGNIVVCRGTPARAWCMRCWPVLKGAQLEPPL
jgi:hypothetical protein